MKKPVFGLLLGGVLGIFDGLTALISVPATKPQIVQIVIGSTIKGLIVGVLIGWFARRVHSVAGGVLFGLGIGLAFAFLVAVMPANRHYYWQIMLPGGIVGVIVGFATQKFKEIGPAADGRRA